MLMAAAVIGVGLVGYAFAQDAGNNGGGRRPGRGNFDPAAWQKALDEQMKKDLGLTDDEWKALQPKVEKVREAQRGTRAGGMFGMMVRRGGQRPGGAQPAADGNQPAAPKQSEVQKTHEALTKVLENKESKPEEVKAALTAYRDARTKAKTDLEKAQKELKELLTPRQEAQLVAQGMLE